MSFEPTPFVPSEWDIRIDQLILAAREDFDKRDFAASNSKLKIILDYREKQLADGVQLHPRLMTQLTTVRYLFTANEKYAKGDFSTDEAEEETIKKLLRAKVREMLQFDVNEKNVFGLINLIEALATSKEWALAKEVSVKVMDFITRSSLMEQSDLAKAAHKIALDTMVSIIDEIDRHMKEGD